MSGFWERLAALVGPVQPLRTHGSDLVTCRACEAEAVIPIQWDDLGDGWRMVLRCGNCGARRHTTLHDDEAAEYGCALDRGVDQISRTVAVVERRRLAARSSRWRSHSSAT